MEGVFYEEILFDSVMKDDWKEVIKVYRECSEIHKVRITTSGDTALHLAVLTGKEDVVEQLIEVLPRQRAEDALTVQNDHGDTPLHLAAATGNIRMCERMITPPDNEHQNLEHYRMCLFGQWNVEGHTPLFLAALYGKEQVFKLLYPHCKSRIRDYYRAKNGETILHTAITGEYIGLAGRILRLHPELRNYMDEQGRSPLHILANKPQLFKSCTIFSLPKLVIYKCISVGKLGEPTTHETSDASPDDNSINQTCLQWGDIEGQSDHWCPPNYNKCYFFLNIICRVLRLIFRRVFNSGATGRGLARDEKSKKELPKGEGGLKFPQNYGTGLGLLKLLCKVLVVVFGLGNDIQKIKEAKQKHVWSVQILKEMVTRRGTIYGYVAGGRSGTSPTDAPDTTNAETSKLQGGGKEKKEEMDKKETPILTAARNGIIEVVEHILTICPVAIYDRNSEKKNVVLLAAENRRPSLYDFLRRNYNKHNVFNVFNVLDNKGNSALHLAADFHDSMNPETILGAALQMQWEIKWYEQVRSSMPRNFSTLYNNNGMTATEIFTKTHKPLERDGGKWLDKTAESCSVVAALIASVSFAASITIPGGIQNGIPLFEKELAFRVFTISSLVSLASSVTSLVMFLGILTSRRLVNEFRMTLLTKLLGGLYFLAIATATILVSFCSAHYFILDHRWRSVALAIYGIACLPAGIFLIAHFPTTNELVFAILFKDPTVTLYHSDAALVGQLNVI